MEELKEFLITHYENAIRLKERFKYTEPKEWTSLMVCCELSVQYGHLINTLYHNTYLDENNRNITNTSDEISDVLLQLSYLSYLEKVDFKKINHYPVLDIHVEHLSILLGQLMEALMEKENYRFKKERIGFVDIHEFIEDRIIRMLLVVSNFAKKNGIDMIKSFQNMLNDANGFLNSYVSEVNHISKHNL